MQASKETFLLKIISLKKIKIVKKTLKNTETINYTY